MNIKIDHPLLCDQYLYEMEVRKNDQNLQIMCKIWYENLRVTFGKFVAASIWQNFISLCDVNLMIVPMLCIHFTNVIKKKFPSFIVSNVGTITKVYLSVPLPVRILLVTMRIQSTSSRITISLNTQVSATARYKETERKRESTSAGSRGSPAAAGGASKAGPFDPVTTKKRSATLSQFYS